LSAVAVLFLLFSATNVADNRKFLKALLEGSGRRRWRG
jgi:hypothetical protein